MSAPHWPDIPYARWKPTGDSLHMWLQIAGKFRLAATPWMIHSWHAAMYPTARGFTTGLVPGRALDHEVVFDLHDHRVSLLSSDGSTRSLALEPMSVAAFWEGFTGLVAQVEPGLRLHGSPNEVPDPVPFARQTGAGTYDPKAAHDFWQAVMRADRVFRRFRTGFLGKSSPSHLFWGSLDLAVTRFSGRTAPLHPGGIPALPDAVTREAYSHEVSSAGFWPGSGDGGGGVDEPAFYSYAYPAPDGFAQADPGHPDAYWHSDLGEFILPYAAVATSDDPEGALLGFLQATYGAAADLGGWDRDRLDAPLGRPGVPRPVQDRGEGCG